MKKLIFTIGFIWLIGMHLNAQVISDSLKIANDNCATRLAKEYMLKMGTIENNKKNNPLRASELLKETEFEKESNGVFLISTLSTHRKKLIVLKKGDKIKLLTFNNVGESLKELISFLDDIKSNDEELLKYIDAVQLYIQYSKNTITVNNKIENSDWLNCK